MKKFIFVSTFIFFLWLTSVGEVKACSCAAPTTNNLQSLVKKAYKDSQAVFSGKVLKIHRNEKLFYIEVRFQVEKSWKNKLAKEITITTGLDSAGCGFSFESGEKYLVYAYRSTKNLETNICTRTNLLAQTNKDLVVLNRLKKPISLK
jgi:hypothetical protein